VFQEIERLSPVGGNHRDIPVFFQRVFQEFSLRAAVFNDHDGCRFSVCPTLMPHARFPCFISLLNPIKLIRSSKKPFLGEGTAGPVAGVF
jgi:hypothetical protein